MAGYSAYPRIIDWPRSARSADEVGAFLLADIAHIAGLVAGAPPIADPFRRHRDDDHAQDSPRSSRRADPLCAEQAKAIDRAVFPASREDHLSAIAAKAVCFEEALQPEFKLYAAQVVENARALAAALLKRGFRYGLVARTIIFW